MVKLGYLADLTMIDRNLQMVPPEEIDDANIMMTIVNGKVIYQPGRPFANE